MVTSVKCYEMFSMENQYQNLPIEQNLLHVNGKKSHKKIVFAEFEHDITFW